MKKNPINMAVGAVLILIFALLLFLFQVRTSEVAVVTTFGRVSTTHTNAGIKFKAPWPIQKVHRLDKRIQKLEFTVDQIANGSRGLLEEVAKGKVTGEEEYWSRTDLWDFQANVDGARVGYEGVRPILEQKDPDLAATLDTRFEELQALLDAQRVDDDFTLYDDLTPEQVKELSDAVNALSEPLSHLTASVLG